MVVKTMIVSLITNLFLSIIKVVFGIIGKCNSLISDGIHSFSDLSTDLVAIIGDNLSKKDSDKEHPFGHGKIEYITSCSIGIVIIFLGFSLIKSIFNKEIIIPNIYMIYISLVTIISKYILAYYIYKQGKKINNNILISSAKESKTDVYSSIVVLISIILMQFSDIYSIFKYADIIASIFVSLLIIRTGYIVLKENISLLLEKQIDDEELINKVKNTILKYEEVLEIKEIYIIKYGSSYKINCNIIMSKDITLGNAHKVIDKIERQLEKDKIKYSFFHMEPNI